MDMGCARIITISMHQLTIVMWITNGNHTIGTGSAMLTKTSSMLTMTMICLEPHMPQSKKLSTLVGVEVLLEDHLEDLHLVDHHNKPSEEVVGIHKVVILAKNLLSSSRSLKKSTSQKWYRKNQKNLQRKSNTHHLIS